MSPPIGGVMIAVCTYGELEWQELARERAIPSATSMVNRARAGGAYVATFHEPTATLAGVRNRALEAAERLSSEWIIYLDGDDELEDGYLDAMFRGQIADIIAPAVRYVRAGRENRSPAAAWIPRVPGHRHGECTAECLLDGNYIVVGAGARVATLQAVGGWREWPMYEDWDLWLRAHVHARATFARAPESVYRAHARRDSRNRAPSREEKLAAHRAIEADVLASNGRVALT